MAIPKHVTLHLGKRNYQFDIISHKKVYTAYDLAQTLGEKLDNIAKTLLIEADLPELKKTKKGHYLVVVPASYYVDLAKVKKALKASKVVIASEKAVAKLGLEPGALSPFGTLRGMGVLVDRAISKAQGAIVGAESFTESLRLKMKDLIAVEGAHVNVFGKKNKMKLQTKKATKKAVKKAGKRASGQAGKSKKAVKKVIKKVVKKVAKKIAKKSVKPVKGRSASVGKVVKKGRK